MIKCLISMQVCAVNNTFARIQVGRQDTGPHHVPLSPRAKIRIPFQRRRPVQQVPAQRTTDWHHAPRAHLGVPSREPRYDDGLVRGHQGPDGNIVGRTDSICTVSLTAQHQPIVASVGQQRRARRRGRGTLYRHRAGCHPRTPVGSRIAAASARWAVPI